MSTEAEAIISAVRALNARQRQELAGGLALLKSLPSAGIVAVL